MAASRDLRVLFAVAGGPRVGFGHLVRCRSLARVLGVVPMAAVRGNAATRRRAAAWGWRLVDVGSDDQLRALDAQLVVIDDPSVTSAGAWLRRARRVGLPVASVHDLGIALVDSDLIIDGTVAPNRKARGRAGALLGPDYMLLDPAIRDWRDARRAKPVRVLIALGGGSHRALAKRIANRVAARMPDVDVRATYGFCKGVGTPIQETATRVHWIDASDGLSAELAAATVVVCAGGVTLYEACALGTPSVAVAVNARQGATIRGIARHGGTVPITTRPQQAGIAAQVERLLGDRLERQRMATAGRRLVDGRGALRVAARLRQLAKPARSRRVA